MDSLNESEMEWSVFQLKPKTIDDALQAAIEFESFQKGRRGRYAERRGLRLQAGTIAVPRNTNFKDVPAKSRSRFQGICFFCDEPGHYKAECKEYLAYKAHKESRARVTRQEN